MSIHVGPAVLEASIATFDHQDKILSQHINELSLKRAKMQLLKEAMHEFSVGMQQKGVDFNSNEGVKELLISVHRLYPHLLDHFIQGFPEGVLSQDLLAFDSSVEGIKQACLQEVNPSEIKISKLQTEDLHALVRGIEGQLTIESESAHQIAFDITRIYGDREQIVKIVYEILRQVGELLKGINRNTPSRG